MPNIGATDGSTTGNYWTNHSEMTDNWWMANRSEIDDYQQFKNLFKAKYWSETTQNLIRDNICHGRYKPHIGNSMTAYFLGKVCMAKHLEPAIPEECLINKLLYHYDEEVIRARRGSQIKTIQAMTKLLENYENEEYYRQSRRRNDRPEPRNLQSVSYTHLDVYKRQD